MYLLLGVGRVVHQLGPESGIGLQAGEDTVRQVQRVGHAHQHQRRAGELRSLEDGVVNVVATRVQLVDLGQQHLAAGGRVH